MNFLLPFLASFFLSVILIPITIYFAKIYQLVDNPKRHKHPAIIHTRIVPRAGGLPIYLAILISALVFLPVSQKLVGLLLGGLVLIVVGLIDDKYDLKSPIKFAVQFLAAIIVVFAGVGISFLPNPIAAITGMGYEVWRLDLVRFSFEFFGSHSILILADIAAIFWIVWFINMVNFSSGVDGQMPGIVMVALIIIFASTLRLLGADPTELLVSKLALIGAGATLGFLIFNYYPAKIFPGDSGSYFLGFFVAVLAILSGAKVGSAMLVMAVPLTDGVFTIIRRIATGNSPFKGDRKHLHHRLMELGWGQRRIVLFYQVACAILGAIALLLHTAEKLFAGLVVAVIILGGLLWLNTNLSERAHR